MKKESNGNFTTDDRTLVLLVIPAARQKPLERGEALLQQARLRTGSVCSRSYKDTVREKKDSGGEV